MNEAIKGINDTFYTKSFNKKHLMDGCGYVSRGSDRHKFHYVKFKSIIGYNL